MIEHQESQYLNLMQRILDEGEERGDRTGTGTISIFGPQMEFDISEEFPLLTSKKVNFKAIAHELLWFLQGDCYVKTLKDNGVKIWNEWADENGYLGPVYGVQWRDFGGRVQDEDMYAAGDRYDPNYTKGGVDQISELMKGLKENPLSRRHIVSAWNPVALPEMALPPCHMMFQFYVRGGEYLDCKMYQRSADFFLGVPFNIASYSLLTYMIANVIGLKPGRYVHTFGDAHLYLNHIEQAKEQLSRELRPLPTLKVNQEVDSIFGYKYEDFEVVGYDPHPFIKAPISV